MARPASGPRDGLRRDCPKSGGRLLSGVGAITYCVLVDVLRVITEPRRALALVTVVGATLAAIAAWAWTPSEQFPTATALLVPVIGLAAFATKRGGTRGWTYLAIAWTLCFVAYGAMPEIPPDSQVR